MRVLVLGAAGMIGSRVVAELLRRDHQVTAGVRATGARPPRGVQAVEVDVRSVPSVAAASEGHDVVVSALGGVAHGDPTLVLDVVDVLLAACERSTVARLAVVGGAGSLLVDGVRLIDTPQFPAAWKPGSQAQADALERYQSYEGPVRWTYLSPSDEIEPGERSGAIELGDDQLLRAQDGSSHVSAEDFAVALVDELEAPAHDQRRFTVRSA